MSNGLLIFLTTAWLMAVGSGMGVLLVHDYSPGADVRVPQQWPAQSQIERTPGRPTLVMFAHPDCPCTRASLGELAELMTHCGNQVDAHVLFFQPKGSGDEWLHTDLWESARTIPGVSVAADKDGREMNYFQVMTSGHVLLYGTDGNLLFSGGITSSRGHYGDNAGLTSIMQLLRHEIAFAPATPAFGCSLLNPIPERSEVSTWTR
jgi:hypothetical protein